jgi:hypothetical protein
VSLLLEELPQMQEARGERSDLGRGSHERQSLSPRLGGSTTS